MSSMEQTKAIAQKLASQLGIEITRFDSKGSDRARLARILLSLKVNLVFDVGAKNGQYGRELRALDYRGRIISFEPVAGAYIRLKRAAARDPKWIVAPRTAIGSEEGVISIHVAANSTFSSVTESANLLGHVAAESAVTHEEQAPLVTLNSLAPQYMERGDVAFLKIDVPGFEYEVLHGAHEIFDRLCGVQLDVSLVPLHHGGKPFRFMLDLMESRGFELHSIASALAGDSPGREVQLDSIFVRRGSVDRLAH